MKKSKNTNTVELKPLNEKLYDEFSLQELEQRLETAAWIDICGVHGDECGVDDVTLPDPQTEIQ